MFNLRDILLLIVVYGSVTLGILYPETFAVCRPLPFYCLIVLFFFSYLPIRMDLFLKRVRGSMTAISIGVPVKLIVLPVLVWWGFQQLLPAYAPAALLMTAISTGVTAPFIAGMAGANVALVLTFVVVTSFLVPLTVPLLVQLLLARAVSIPYAGMVGTLAVVIFTPIAVVEILRKTAPRVIAAADRIRFPASLALFAITNLGVFSQYADVFYRSPFVIVEALLVAVGLALVYFLTGLLVMRGRAMADQLAGAVIFTNINNIMVMVFASRFFEATEATVAAMYNIPFFAVILLMRWWGRPRGAGVVNSK